MTLYISIDGAARGNPGPAALGVVVRDEKGQTVRELSRLLEPRTNNQAEYAALLAALEVVAELRPAAAVIRTDSELLYFQVTGRYRVRHPKLKLLHAQAEQRLAVLPPVRFELVPRTANREADRLANYAFSGRRTDKQESPASVPNLFSED